MATGDFEIFTMYGGFKFECHDCHGTIEDGQQFARMDDDSSTVLCMDCLTARQNLTRQRGAPIGPTETKPDDRPREHKRGHRRRASWMEFD